MTLAEALDEEELGISIPELEARISSVGLRIARTLASSLPHLADLGLDLGIARNGQIYFIECNGRDQRYGFRKAECPNTGRPATVSPWHMDVC